MRDGLIESDTLNKKITSVKDRLKELAE